MKEMCIADQLRGELKRNGSFAMLPALQKTKKEKPHAAFTFTKILMRNREYFLFGLSKQKSLFSFQASNVVKIERFR